VPDTASEVALVTRPLDGEVMLTVGFMVSTSIVIVPEVPLLP